MRVIIIIIIIINIKHVMSEHTQQIKKIKICINLFKFLIFIIIIKKTTKIIIQLTYKLFFQSNLMIFFLFILYIVAS
jgi:hypothetical protein